jgi:hypothetical protein
MLSARVEGGRDLPRRLENKRREFMERGRHLIHEDLVSEAPYRHIAESAWAKRRGFRISAGYDAVDAKAHDRGAYIVPKNGRALRFADGSFRARARLKPQWFFERVMNRAHERLRQAFRETF